jgi:hypothetical protein
MLHLPGQRGKVWDLPKKLRHFGNRGVWNIVFKGIINCSRGTSGTCHEETRTHPEISKWKSTRRVSTTCRSSGTSQNKINWLYLWWQSAWFGPWFEYQRRYCNWNRNGPAFFFFFFVSVVIKTCCCLNQWPIKLTAALLLANKLIEAISGSAFL